MGISLGDPSGIGPEVTAAALASARLRNRCIPVLFGDAGTFDAFPRFRRLPRLTEAEAARPFTEPTAVIVSTLQARERRPGRPSLAGGRAQLAYVEAVIAAAQDGRLEALCTAPVSKEQITRSGVRFMGHTEVLAERFRARVMMLMDGPRVKVALATNHLALAQVPEALDRRNLVAQLTLLHQALRPVLGRGPRIAVCGLNPHAGEGGLLGREEVEVIGPAVRAAQKKGVRCEGPLPADGLFARVSVRALPYDVALVMYHDQGLVLAKALDFERTVNVTLGLPVPRTSPDHGVAYDLAGTGRASAAPMVAALEKAVSLALALRR